ncbi:hypothetical protein EGT74_06415 [Chitinophaga lutea]|uniref:Uncharacterized protein n=1 Tax=Chitinophaga lutea TaxID=2488634 RepID=A0A3N4QAZ3_9BACT|nr:hypothetical protein [Chitinophaga lutea]RPE13160.1 hypothetical protein EGT74_06415 [Chitinophaga lutea]
METIIEQNKKNLNQLTQNTLPDLGFKNVFDKQLVERLPAAFENGLRAFSMACKSTDKEPVTHIITFERKNDKSDFYVQRIASTLEMQDGKKSTHIFDIYNRYSYNRTQMENLLKGRWVRKLWKSQKTGKLLPYWMRLDFNKLNDQKTGFEIERIFESQKKIDYAADFSRIPLGNKSQAEKEALMRDVANGNNPFTYVWIDNLETGKRESVGVYLLATPNEEERIIGIDKDGKERKVMIDELSIIDNKNWLEDAIAAEQSNQQQPLAAQNSVGADNSHPGDEQGFDELPFDPDVILDQYPVPGENNLNGSTIGTVAEPSVQIPPPVTEQTSHVSNGQNQESVGKNENIEAGKNSVSNSVKPEQADNQQNKHRKGTDLADMVSQGPDNKNPKRTGKGK